MRLVNTTNSQLQDLPPDKAASAFVAGTHNLYTKEPVYLKAPSGTIGVSDPQDVYPSLTEGGYSFPSDNEIKEYQMQQKYDNPTGEAESFALGAANAASFGMIPRALIGTGALSQEAATELPRINPKSNIAGQVAGIGTSLLLSPEAEGLQLAKEAVDTARAGGDAVEIAKATNALKAAKNTLTAGDALNPVSAVSKLGGQITGALTPEGAGLANAALRTAGSAVGSAAEGLAYSGGNINYEEAIGDPTLNAQKAISELGWGAALGGALGGTLTAGEIALPKAYETAKEGLGGFKDWAMGTESNPGPLVNNYAKASSWVSGKDPADITGAIFNRFQEAETPEARQALIKETTDKGQKLFNSNEQALKQTATKIRPIESSQLIPPEAAPAANSELQRVVSKYDEAIEQIKSDPARYDQKLADTLETHRDSMLQRPEVAVSGKDILSGTIPDLQAPAYEVFDAINKAKQDLGSVSKFGRELTGPERNTVNEVLRPLGGELQGSLENENIWGEAGARQAAFNQAQSEYMNAANEFKKTFMQKRIGSNGGVFYSSSPSKWSTFLNQMTDAKGAIKQEIFKNYLDASNKMLSEVGNSFEKVANGRIDIPEALAKAKSSADVAMSATKEAENHVNSVKDLFEKQQYAKRLGHTGGILEGGFVGRIAEAMGLPAQIAYPAAATFEGLKNPGTTISRLAQLEKLVQNATKKIEVGAARALRPVSDSAAAIAPKLGANMAEEKMNSMEQYQKVSKQVMQLAKNPELFSDKIEAASSSLYPVAQKTTAGVNNSLASGVGFLSSKLPVQNPVGPFSVPRPPNDAEVSKFLKYYKAVEKPMSVLDDLKNNRVSLEGVEAVKSVYPQLFDAMRSQVVSEFANLKERPSYQKRLALSMFLGQDMDSSTQGVIVANNQAPYAMQKAGLGQQGKIKPTSKGLGNINLASRIQTPQEKTAKRGET